MLTVGSELSFTSPSWDLLERIAPSIESYQSSLDYLLRLDNHEVISWIYHQVTCIFVSWTEWVQECVDWYWKIAIISLKFDNELGSRRINLGVDQV